MAINFHTGLMDQQGTPIKGASSKVRLASANAMSKDAKLLRGNLQNQIDEIQWWISKGLSWLPPYTGIVTRAD